jgi:hypothetical protein
VCVCVCVCMITLQVSGALSYLPRTRTRLVSGVWRSGVCVSVCVGVGCVGVGCV